MAGVTKTNYDSYKSDYGSFKSAVESLASSTLSAGTIDGFQTKIADVDVGAFGDAVGAAFKTNQTKNKADIQKISDDVSSGGFNTIKTALTSLEGANGEFESARTKRDTAKTERSKMDEQVVVDTKKVDGKDVDVYGPNPNIPAKDKEIAGYEKDMETAVNKINGLLGTIAGASFGGATADENPTSGDETGDSDSSGDDSSQTPQEGLQPFEGNEDLLYDTYEYTDEYGETHQYEILVNPQDGSIIVGNAEDGYRLYSRGEDGSLYPAYIKQSATNGGEYNMANVSYLLTDGHQNDYNSGWGLSPSNTYGRNGELAPLPGPSATQTTVNINGTDVTIATEAGDNGSINAYFNK